MTETDDVQLKAEIDSIMKRVDRIMETVDSMDPDQEETPANEGD